MIREKSGGAGRGSARGLSNGLHAVVPLVDRRPSATETQKVGILDDDSHDELLRVGEENEMVTTTATAAAPQKASAPPRRIKAHVQGPSGELSGVCERGIKQGLVVHSNCWSQGCACPCHSAK